MGWEKGDRAALHDRAMAALRIARCLQGSTENGHIYSLYARLQQTLNPKLETLNPKPPNNVRPGVLQGHPGVGAADDRRVGRLSWRARAGECRGRNSYK